MNNIQVTVASRKEGGRLESGEGAQDCLVTMGDDFFLSLCFGNTCVYLLSLLPSRCIICIPWLFVYLEIGYHYVTSDVLEPEDLLPQLTKC